MQHFLNNTLAALFRVDRVFELWSNEIATAKVAAKLPIGSTVGVETTRVPSALKLTTVTFGWDGLWRQALGWLLRRAMIICLHRRDGILFGRHYVGKLAGKLISSRRWHSVERRTSKYWVELVNVHVGNSAELYLDCQLRSPSFVVIRQWSEASPASLTSTLNMSAATTSSKFASRISCPLHLFVEYRISQMINVLTEMLSYSQKTYDATD